MKPPDSERDDDRDRLPETGALVDAPPPSPSPRSDVTRRLGMVLRGKYRLENVLGIGGMAVVYRAVHRNQAEYAIKMLLPEHAANEDLRTRFLREGYAANSVKHPGVVRVMDDDVAEDGAAFLVLELLHGIACDKLATAHGGRLPVDAACAIGLQALDVLRAAHMNGIIHRDIKPANLFLLRSGEVKVLDFGIARVRETLATGTHSTGSGVLLGTPAFMAPEQAMGKSSDVDARADVWSIGASLFALMSGLNVHEGESGRELLVKLITQPTRSLFEVVPDIPLELADVVDRALDVDREQRWASATAMRDALDAASRPLWQERPPRAVLAALVEPLVPQPAASRHLFQDPEGQKRSVPPAAPTLRAEERPKPSNTPPKASGETARAVSRSGSAARPRRRISPLVFGALGLFGTLAVLMMVTDLVGVRGRAGEDSPQSSSSSEGAALAVPAASPSVVATVVSPPTPAPAVSPSPAPAGSETAVVPPDAARAARSRGPSKPEPDAPPTMAAPPLAAPTPASSPVAAPASADVPAAASVRLATPPNCNPPYYYDSKMNRVFKKECL